MGKPVLYKGKTRQQIAQEALEKLGPEATRQQVDAYFGRYGITNGCEASMFWTERAALRRKLGLPVGVRENDKLDISMQDVQEVLNFLRREPPKEFVPSINDLKDTLDLIERVGAAKVRMAIDFIEEIKK